MRTTIAIDEELIKELMRFEGDVSRSEAIRRAVEDYLVRQRIDRFMELAGSGLVDMDRREAKSADVRKVKRHGRKR
jgi:metal-responsive CopG/Arc/MetJ family transcriptional regulator